MERAALHEQVVVALTDFMDRHDPDPDDMSRCVCGYREPHGLGIGVHQLEAAADSVLDQLVFRGLPVTVPDTGGTLMAQLPAPVDPVLAAEYAARADLLPPLRDGRRPGLRPARPGGRWDPDGEGRVIAATVTLLAQCGVGGFALDHVADEARCSKATIYRRWRSANAVTAAAVETLGPRLEDVIWPDPGGVREDLIAALCAATAGLRARAEVAVLSHLPYQSEWRAAWQEGPRRRRAAVFTACRARARARGDADRLPGPVRVDAALALLWVKSALHGGEPDGAEVAAVVDGLLLDPRPAGGEEP